MFAVGTVTISYSMFKTAAVMLPPNVAAPLKVTKSPTIASCPLSVTVIVVDPLVAAKVAALVVVLRIGVTSLKEPPSSM